MMTRSAALELAPHGIRVVARGPGVHQHADPRQGRGDEGGARKQHLHGKLIEPEKVASVVAFLFTDGARRSTARRFPWTTASCSSIRARALRLSCWTAAARRVNRSSSATIPANTEVVEVRIPELRRLFNSIDPSPFHDRDLDPSAEEFIVNWAAEIPRSRPLGLLVHVGNREGSSGETAALADAINQSFARRAQAARRRLRELFRRGRISLLIGLAFLAASSLLANALAGPSRRRRYRWHSARQHHHRGLGGNVAPAGAVPLRLVAYSRRGEAL